MTVLPAPDFARADVDAFAWRVLRDAWTEATTAYWERRARQLEAARPRRSDYVPPHITAREIHEQYDRLTAAAAACRARGRFLDASRAEFHQALVDVAAGAAA